MVDYKYNEPYYKIKFNELEDDKLRIISFSGDEGISELFEYRIELISDDPEIDSSKILNQKATFILTRGDEDPIQINGIISRFEQRGRTPDYVSYYAELVPKLWHLNLTHHSAVYQNTDIQKLITEILEDSNFASDDYKFDLTGSYPQLEYVVQYRESNLNFINRRLEHYGIFYYFDQKADNDVVVFTDSNDKLKKIKQKEDIFYNPNKDPLSENETISELTCEEKVVTGAVKLKDYNYQFPEKQLLGESQIDSNFPGTFYDYGDNFDDQKQAESLAKVRNQEILSKSKIYNGTSDCRLFKAGQIYKMGKHYREKWNSEYIVVKLKSEGNQQGLFGILPFGKKIKSTYVNHFYAIPTDIDYRPPRNTPIPKVSGIMSAKLESSAGDEYAFMDDQGRYKAKMFFDLADSSKGDGTLPIRLSQPYTGAGYGMHFPNHEDTELVWACVDGNVDRPMGIATVPNPSNTAPTTNTNKTQNVIRTAAGNEIILDDKTDEAQIGITTPDANKLLFDDKDDKIELTTKDKHKITFDDKNQKINVKSKDGHKILMDDKNTKIEVVSKNEHFITINDKGGEEKIQISDKDKKNTFIIDIANKKLVIETAEGAIDILAPQGEINMKSKTLNIESTGDTSMKAANIKSEAQQDYKVKAMGITAEASMDLKLKGMNAEIKGDMDLKAEGGMNAEVKGGMAAKLEGGVTADVKGGAKTAVSGAIVMIN